MKQPKHEKILVRENGSKLRITVEYCIPLISGEPYYSHYVDVMAKQNWQRVLPDCKVSAPDEEFRAAWLAEELKHVTKQEIHQAKLELWEKLKPVEE